jgi:hypothetical protein
MKRIEIIRIRLARGGYEDVLTVLQQLAGGSDDTVVRIYRHAAVGSDIAIHLHTRASDSEPAFSETGQHLASALKEIGLVNRSVWLEIDREYVNGRITGDQS